MVRIHQGAFKKPSHCRGLSDSPPKQAFAWKGKNERYGARFSAKRATALGALVAPEGANTPFDQPSMPQANTPQWVTTLRSAVAGQFPRGWLVSEQSGKVKLTIKYSDGSRSSGMLPHAWKPASHTQLLNSLNSIRGSVEAGRPLKEAIQLLSASASTATPTEPGSLNWPELTERFRLHKLTSGALAKESTWRKDYLPHMTQIIEVMLAKCAPKTGKQVLQALVTRHGGTPGSRGRQIRLQHAAQLLRFAVDECGAEQRWLAPANISELVGAKPAAHAGRDDSTPIKDEQLTRLIEGIPDPRWRLAVQLMACFGLRPVELKYIRPTKDGARLHCSYCKRTAKGSTKPREIVGIDPAGHPAMSIQLLAQLAAIGRVPGATELPPLGNTDRATASAIDTYLRRREDWTSLKAECEASGGALTVYSFRHGYALRCHETGLMPRATAALMGHSLQTHSAHYGQWTDSETIAAAVARTTAAQELRHKKVMQNAEV